MRHIHTGSVLVAIGFCAVHCFSQPAALREQTAEVLQSWVRASTAVARVRIRTTDTYERWNEGRFVAHFLGRNELLTSVNGSASRGQAVVIEHGKATMEETRIELQNRDYEARLMSPDGVRWRVGSGRESGTGGEGVAAFRE